MEQFAEFATNNWELFLALGVILALLARSWLVTGGVKGIRPLEAVGLSNHNNAVFLDVRTDKEYEEGHILHSYHAPLGLIDSKIAELTKFKARPIIVVCRSGNRSGSAASLLKKNGFEEIYNLSGGIMAWQSSNLPLTKSKEPPPPPPPEGSDKESRQEPSTSENDTVASTVTDSGSTNASNEKNISAESILIGKNVTVYTTQRCPFCVKALSLLDAKGVGYTEINIENKPNLRQEMESRAQRKTVPQIFIGDIHVGGCDDIYALENNGRLDGLLGLKTA